MTTMKQAQPGRQGLSLKRMMFWLHIWIGLALGIPFALLGITGSILVYEQPITAFFSPAPAATATGEMRSPQAIIDAALATRPGSIAQTLSWPQQRGEAAIVRLTAAGETGRRAAIAQAFVDPVSLEVLDVRQATPPYWMGLMHDLHGSMLVGGRDGRALVGWFGVGMLGLGLSGIVLWWPRGSWRGAYGVTKYAHGWLLYRQLHGTCGITGWLLFIVLSFSGIAIAFPETTTALVRTTLGLGPSTIAPLGPGVLQSRVTPVAGAERIDANKALELARAAAPESRPVLLFLANGADQPVRINLLPKGASQGAPTMTITIDPYRAETIAVRDPWAGDAGDNVMAWQRPLHTGRGTNALYRAAIFVIGLLPPVFAVTGMLMWWSKRRARAANRRPEAYLQGVAAE